MEETNGIGNPNDKAGTVTGGESLSNGHAHIPDSKALSDGASSDENEATLEDLNESKDPVPPSLSDMVSNGATNKDTAAPKPTEKHSSVPSKMRIKLKMPKLSASGLPAKRPPPQASSSSSATPKMKMLPLSKKPRITLPTTKTKSTPPDTVGSTADKASNNNGNKPPSASDKPKSRIRSLKLPMNSKPDDTGSSSVATSNTSSKLVGKRRLGQAARVRIPYLTSPGLKVPAVYNGKAYELPSQVFDAAMETAGYSLEARTQKPYRGSSTTRTVGDMFDSNTKLTLHFPPLVPPELWKGDSQDGADGPVSKEQLPDRLIGILKRSREHEKTSIEMSLENANGDSQSKRSITSGSYKETLPVSLTIPYPDSFIQRQLDYKEQVFKREVAIRKRQAAELDLEPGAELPPGSLPKIPPIPHLPTPPVMSFLPGFLDEHQDNFPLYPPKTSRDFVGHLDPQCFHVSEGRYFGLSSNRIADPNFVGANAPGIGGSNAAGGAGLATSTAGTQGTTLMLTSAFYKAAVQATTSGRKKKVSPKSSDGAFMKVVIKREDKKSPTSDVKKQTSPNTSASAAPAKSFKAVSALKQMMEDGGSGAESMRERIMRSAVHASRTGNHGKPFSVGENVFSDVSKAFAAYAGVKACARCKSNKQGAYHCRLKRKHDEDDWDGGSSQLQLKPLFDMPLEELLEEDDD